MSTRLILTLAIVSPFFAGLMAEAPQRATERSFAVSAGGQLEVQAGAGDILTRSSNKNEVYLRASGVDESELITEQTGDLLRIVHKPGSRGSRDVRFEIDIPASWNLNLSTGGGDISVEGTVGGRIRARTGGGDIAFDDVDGEVSVESSGGDIHGGSVRANVSVRTMGGDIKLGPIEGDAEVVTMGGDILLERVGGTLKTTTMGGDIEVRDVSGSAEVTSQGGDVLLGRVSGGAVVNTAGGDVHLEGADGHAEIQTAGGDISLSNISGSVKARTAGGDIEAEISPAGSESHLESAGGDIRVTIPSNARATVEAAIETGRWGRRDYQITSDFEAEPGSFVRGEDSIRGTYPINGGGPRITLNTAGGNIRIQRGSL